MSNSAISTSITRDADRSRTAQFDVMVTGNIFGEHPVRLRGNGVGLARHVAIGFIGPIDKFGRRKALYERSTGSAPDIAGKGIANPLGSILSVAMMLRMTLNRPEDADLLEKAVDCALATGARTADIAEPGAKKLSTVERWGMRCSAPWEKVAAKEKERA